MPYGTREANHRLAFLGGMPPWWLDFLEGKINVDTALWNVKIEAEPMGPAPHFFCVKKQLDISRARYYIHLTDTGLARYKIR